MNAQTTFCRRLRAWSGRARASVCSGPVTSPPRSTVIGTDPVVNVFADYRTRITQLDPRWLGGEMWGYFDGDRLASLCHVGANLVPVNATPEACEAFVDRAIRTVRAARRSSAPMTPWRCSGPGSRSTGRRPRDFRWDQPHLVATQIPTGPRDPLVRRTHEGRGRRALPGLRGDVHRGGRHQPRARRGPRPLPRARQPARRPRLVVLADRGRAGGVQGRGRVRDAHARARSRGCTSTRSCAGRDCARAGMATVVDLCLREIAPVGVALRQRAQRAGPGGLRAGGLRQTGTFSTIMF